MKQIATLLFLLFSSYIVQSQTIRGYVFSGKEKKPVEYATVSLLQLPDSSVVNGVSTLASGLFVFTHVKAGNYFVKASLIGYQRTGRKIRVVNNHHVIQADTLFMQESAKQIGEVTVSSERIKGKELVDRTVYSIPAQIAKTSTDGFEILKKIPSIQVDFNNNITLNGSSNFIIQVDGQVRDKEYLAKLLPSDIKSVEVINNPTGKYEGNVDGVINIILKKEARYGISGNFRGGIRTYKELSGGVNGSLDYGLGKVTLYATAYSFFQHLSVFSKGYYNYSSLLDSISNLSGDGKFKLSANSINTGFDYYINDKNNLSFNVNFRPIVQDISVTNQGDILKDSVLNHFMKYPSVTNTNNDETNISLFYRKQYAKPIKELTSEIRFYNYTAKGYNDYTRKYYDVANPGLLTDSLPDLENTRDNRNSYTAKIDYVNPLGISTRFEAGYQFYYQIMRYKFKRNNLLNDLFTSDEIRNAAYAGIVYNYKKFGFQTDLRGEYSNVNVHKPNPSNYLCLLPIVNIQYKFTGTQNVKFTYNRRINRPGISDLDPYQKVTGTTLSSGNPALKPEYRDKLELTYSSNFGKNYLSPYIYHEFIKDKIGITNQYVNSPLLGGTTILSSPSNILSGYEEGVGVNGMLWFFNINARFYKGHYNSYNQGITHIPSINYSSYSLNSYMYGQLPLKINGFAFINYNGVNVNAQSKTYSTAFYGFGAQKIVGKHTFGFFYLLPFSKDITLSKTKTSFPGFYSETSYGFNVSYYIQVYYSFRFNKGRTVKKLSRKEDLESDSKTQGIGR